MQSKAVLQIFLITATLLGLAGYFFVNPSTEPVTGS